MTGMLRLPDTRASLPAYYRTREPFPYVVLDGVLKLWAPTVAEEVRRSYKRLIHEAYSYYSPLEKKLAEDRLERLPYSVQSLLRELNDPAFLIWLEALTGISGLISDPYYRGGGLHMIPPGGKLDVHVDYNVHPILHLARRVNVLLYLNPEWDQPGGSLELWEGHEDSNGKAVLTRRELEVPPLLGRMVIFGTSDRSYHGHPVSTDPEGPWRFSLATYYYTVPGLAESPHSTAFVARPGDPPDADLDALRAERAKGRTTSSVTVEGRHD